MAAVPNVATVEASAKPAAEVAASASKKSTRSVNGAKPSDKMTKTDKETGVKSSEKVTKTEKEPAKKREYKKLVTHLCGLKEDGEHYENRTKPRITTSQATPEEAAMYQRIIDSIMHPHTLYGKRVDFDPNDIMAVMIEVQPYLASEPVLIEDIPFGINIVGDVHGQLYDLDRVFKIHEKDGKPGYLCSKFLFMGDYVDRGLQSLEVIMLLFCLKMLYPDNFFLLRGNHEFVRINQKYGFGKECFERYCEEVWFKIFAQCNETFMYLSLAAIVGNVYFCTHGGISSRQFNREEMKGLWKPITHSAEDFLIQDIMWSDPAVGLKGTVFNYTRGNALHFGLDALVRALHDMGCIALFRGHTLMTNGFENLWDICFTVFTCTSDENDGAVAYVDEAGKVHKHILVMCEKRDNLMKEFLKKEEAGTVEDCGGGKTVEFGEK